MSNEKDDRSAHEVPIVPTVQEQSEFLVLLEKLKPVQVPSRVMRKFVCSLWLNEVSQQ